MVEINVKKSLSNYYTNDDGDLLFNEIKILLSDGQKVTVSFDGIAGLNSSFVNSAFVKLLDVYSYDYIKNNIKFVRSNKQINNLIASRFKFEVTKKMYA